MAVDLPVDLSYATVRISQQLPDGRYGQGTGFLISAPTPDGTPRLVMITADHVFSTKMLGDQVQIGWRIQDPSGHWRYTPQTLRIRAEGKSLWTTHPQHDIAAIAVQAPPEIARAAIPLAWVADADTFDRQKVRPGDVMMTTGFPAGLSATPEGFPILRSGALGSWPVSPVASYPTFIIDAAIFPGNSGGPVFVAKAGAQFIAGVLAQDVAPEGRSLNLGIVVHAQFIRETIALMDGAPVSSPAPAPVPAAVPATP